MQSLKAVIASRQKELRQHELFEVLERTRSTLPLARMAKALAWWPMVFQDVLRQNFDLLQGSDFARFAEYHRNEDSGHEQWYLEDLRALRADPPDLSELFDAGYQPIRDACYSLIAEVHREQSPKLRVALLLALEPTGHVFFEQISATVDRVCPDLGLRYFARFHLGVEKDHDLFTESTDAELERIRLTDEERGQAEAMVGRIYETFTNVFTYLADEMTRGTRTVSHVRELAGAAPEQLMPVFNVRRSS